MAIPRLPVFAEEENLGVNISFRNFDIIRIYIKTGNSLYSTTGNPERVIGAPLWKR